MTKKQRTYHAGLIKQVHVSRRYREHYRDHRDDYEDLLVAHFGVESSKQLDIEQLKHLVAFLNFEAPGLPILIRPACEPLATEAQIGKIRKMWQLVARDTGDGALLNFIERQTRRRFPEVEELYFEEAQKLIPVLERMKVQAGER